MRKLCKYLVVISLFLCHTVMAQSDDEILDSLFRNSYRFWELSRNNKGLYSDYLRFQGGVINRGSTAAVGMGLVALCIGDAMGWEENAEELALETLRALTGADPTFQLDANASGYHRHFFDTQTGAQMGNSEYSTIDTGIMVAGALFAKRYFGSDSISFYADKLEASVDFTQSIYNEDQGRLYLVMNPDGTGDPSALTHVYNEYMIVAWLARNQTTNTTSPAYELWENYYEKPENLPKNRFNNIGVLTDNPSSFLSSFTHQFNYFLCNPFTTSPEYIAYFDSARLVDSIWWSEQQGAEDYEWGTGAGATSLGYHADKINNNPTLTVSPHIIAGFLPVSPGSVKNLINMYRVEKGVYTLPGSSNEVLWRYSVLEPSYRASNIQAIDFSSMVLGLATLPQYLGPNFFKTYNDFYSPTVSVQGDKNRNSLREDVKWTHKSPFSIRFKLEESLNKPMSLFDAKGAYVEVNPEYKGKEVHINLQHLRNGIYFLYVGNRIYTRILKY